MSRVEEIKAAIDQLSPEERCELAALLNPIEDDDWDRQMKEDTEPGGKLDRIKEAANKEYDQGKSLPFPKPSRVKSKTSREFWKLFTKCDHLV
jgi:hypothetical protein